MSYEWAVPAAGEAWDHREEIASAWKRFLSWLLGAERSIAVTGMPGAGKTVLLDYLSDRAFSKSYVPPDPSPVPETGKIPTRGKSRLRLTTVPGQSAGPRLAALDELFSDNEAVDGVVHVVCNGFVALRDAQAQAVLRDDLKLDTIQKFRDYQLAQELEDLDDTCELIRKAVRAHRRPAWMLVAVTKADLFCEQKLLRDAEAYYSPSGKGKFGDRVRELQKQVGYDNFRWAARPVCAWLEDFEWAGNTRKTGMADGQRNALLGQFAGLLEGYCGSATT